MRPWAGSAGPRAGGGSTPGLRLTRSKAVANIIQEQGRMRGPAVKLPGEKENKWTEELVCGVVYEDAIKDLVEEMSRLKAGSKDGWIAEYPKARAAIYYTLSDEDREAVGDVCKAWNRGGIPKTVKKK